MASPSDLWRKSSLLIVGHGRSDSPESTRLIQGHADPIARQNIFNDVQTGFIKRAPFMAEELAKISSDTVYIVPCFASPGSLTKTVIPEELSLSGRQTQRNGQTLKFAEPVGNHPLVGNRFTDLVRSTVQMSASAAMDTTVLVIGHGSTHNPQSEIDTQTVAASLDSLGQAKSLALFLDQSPNLNDWRDHCDTPNIIVATHLFSGGSHETKDVPELLVIEPDLTQHRLTSANPIGPIEVDGKRLWLCPPIGADPIVQDVILERVRELDQS